MAELLRDRDIDPGTVLARVLLCFCFLSLIAACSDTSGRWENANLPSELWDQDQTDCRVWARQRVEKELGQFEDRWGDRNYPTSSLLSSLEWHQANRREQELLESCMTEKGYIWNPSIKNAE